MTVPRPIVNVVMLGAAGLGVIVGWRLFEMLAGG
jgi:hypothetical protein